jgi:hypothetical protein
MINFHHSDKSFEKGLILGLKGKGNFLAMAKISDMNWHVRIFH